MVSNYVNGKQSVMVKKHIRMNVGAVLMAVLAVTVLVSTQSSAQTSTKPNNSTNVLKVSPVRTDVEIKPGGSQTVKTIVTNLTNTPITVRPVENDFVAGDERGTPALILDENKFAPTHSLKRFMKPLEDVTIPANEEKEIEVVITVPKDAKAGGYFGAVRFAPTDPSGGAQVNLSASAASLILLTVPGNMVEKLSLTDFDIQQDGKSGTFFNTPTNLQTSFRFKNEGSSQVGPFGKISVKHGDKVVYEADFNDKTPREMILPDSARRWDVPVDKVGTFGNYTITGTFSYGQKNQTIEVSKSFWVIPLGIVIAAVVAIIALIALAIGIWFFLRNYKKRILNSQDNHRR